ncbi:hypothetical protein SAMN05661012_00507 [Chitinophaga sancti]|uniref:Uncharacterized protein n=1 Tax=Chitinophaga sancti TaxID=1004 RepID=A0A1K1M7Q1_9BACT|nr:hypothetical protein SAMN05661012_00507 [Chitinophaga sancti]
MENGPTTPNPVWVTPDMNVFEVNDLTLLNGGAGFDFGSEAST